MNFLLEIGSEEIPDWMIPAALDYLRAQFPNSQADATSRRLTLRVTGLLEREADRRELVQGPAVNSPAQAVQGFAKKQGVQVEDLQQQNGKYTYSKHIPGQATRNILAETLPSIILKTPWPKTMYWTSKAGARFVRPIRWIVALFNDEIVPFEVAGVHSGNHSSGHRRLGQASFPVTFDDYEEQLRENGVILSAATRQKKIEDEIHVRIKPDPALMQTLVYLTEFPTVVTGNFDESYLTLPEEVLITVMRYHQKYFSVENHNGKLAPHFVAVMNTASDPDGLVQRGNERVLRARFNDARFFWDADQKRTLEQRVPNLGNVTFQAKLGTYLDKTQRVEGLVAILGGDDQALRAARLCKVDLTTELVKEFTELQGIIGGLYAKAQGESEAVATAIYDHYKPSSMEDTIPRTAAGQILSIADKLDTLIGCFQNNIRPTGSKDPFALRRAGQGIVKIIAEAKLNIRLKPHLLGADRLDIFMEERVRHYFQETKGFNYDEVAAVLARNWDDIVDVEARLEAVKAVRPTADFEPLAAAFKRIRNILRQAGDAKGIALNTSLLEPGPEKQLHDVFKFLLVLISGKVDSAHAFVGLLQELHSSGVDITPYQCLHSLPINARLPYREALVCIATLRPTVDLFFDKVMVNVPDEQLRANRLALLHAVLTEFSTIADFSEIVTNS
jgi:glycyl-tRNA synthetase beta chain